MKGAITSYIIQVRRIAPRPSAVAFRIHQEEVRSGVSWGCNLSGAWCSVFQLMARVERHAKAVIVIPQSEDVAPKYFKEITFHRSLLFGTRLLVFVSDFSSGYLLGFTTNTMNHLNLRLSHYCLLLLIYSLSE